MIWKKFAWILQLMFFGYTKSSWMGKQEITYLTKVEISLHTIYTNVQNKNKISKMKNAKISATIFCGSGK